MPCVALQVLLTFLGLFLSTSEKEGGPERALSAHYLGPALGREVGSRAPRGLNSFENLASGRYRLAQKLLRSLYVALSGLISGVIELRGACGLGGFKNAARGAVRGQQALRKVGFLGEERGQYLGETFHAGLGVEGSGANSGDRFGVHGSQVSQPACPQSAREIIALFSMNVTFR